MLNCTKLVLFLHIMLANLAWLYIAVLIQEV